MLTLQFIRENREFAVERLRVKNFDASSIINQIIALDDERRKGQQAVNDKQAEMNALSKQIGQFFQEGKRDEAEQAKKQTITLKQEIKSVEESFTTLLDSIQHLLVQLPNIPHADVPAGKGEMDNLVVETGGDVPTLNEQALPHWELAHQYQLIDFELGNKLTGAGFPVYRGKGAVLQRALINFFLNEASQAGYEEILPPFLVNEASGFGTGQLPDKEGQMYHVTGDNLYLIPTAEVPVTNIYRDVILKPDDFPVKNTAYTPCWRREAGSYGKDVRGLNRLHQFDKVEIVQIDHPSRSYITLETMLQHAVGLVKKLELPYRVLKLCGGDMSFTSALTYDIEVYSAAQQRWLEVSSVSNFESYQANRLALRFKEKGEKKTQLAHTLNGSALALPRIVAALLENNQTTEGIRVPASLQPYTGFDLIC